MAHKRHQMPIRSDVRFGSKADMCSAKGHVRFTPKSDAECVHSNVGYGPIADSCAASTIDQSSARSSTVGGIASPMDLAVFRLMASSNFVGRSGQACSVCLVSFSLTQSCGGIEPGFWPRRWFTMATNDPNSAACKRHDGRTSDSGCARPSHRSRRGSPVA